jgi:hypothetical protein
MAAKRLKTESHFCPQNAEWRERENEPQPKGMESRLQPVNRSAHPPSWYGIFILPGEQKFMGTSGGWCLAVLRRLRCRNRGLTGAAVAGKRHNLFSYKRK